MFCYRGDGRVPQGAAPGDGAAAQPQGAVPFHPQTDLEHGRRLPPHAAQRRQGHRSGGDQGQGRHEDSVFEHDRESARRRFQADHQRLFVQRQHAEAGTANRRGSAEVRRFFASGSSWKF